MSVKDTVKNKFSRYVDGKPIKGVYIDYNRVNKEFKRMMKECNAPDGLYNPDTLPMNDANWFVLMSERSSSKTTQILLYALIIYKLYKVKFCYVRKEKTMITKSMYVKLFNVINNKDYGYIKWLTGGDYDHLTVTTTKDVYFTSEDEKDTSFEAVGVLMDIEEYARYCSSFNTTEHDIIILDEFSWGRYTQDEFFHFCQLIATIRRERITVKIIMLSNTISPYNNYLQELGISTQLAKMHKGQKAIITTPLGTMVYCELLEVGMHTTVEFSKTALSYFGFENEQLRSLYGGEWEIKGFKHLPHSASRILEKSPYILDYLGYKMRVCYFVDGFEVGVFIERFTSPIERDDLIIITTEPQYNNNMLNILSPRVLQHLTEFNRAKRVYVSDNETGLAFSGLLESFRLI